MENQPPVQQQYYNKPQAPLPNATAVLVLGIISLVGCFCYGVVGLVCSIIALVLAKKDLQLYKESPSDYSLNSFNNLKAGRICAIIGVCLSAAYLLCIILYLIFVGTVILTHPGEIFHHSYSSY